MPSERQAVRDVAERNAVHAERAGLVLLPVDWETHAVPEMGDRPQAIINRQVLASCDLLVTTFRTRLGGSTGKAASGTVEEIVEHLAAGRPAMLDFSNAPVVPASIDPDQYAALSAFKRECMMQGLIQTYDTLTEFRDSFRKHLTQLVYDRFAGRQPVAGPPAAGPVLSADARELLLVAAGDGQIMSIELLSGLQVGAGGRTFCADGDARAEARWQAAMDELEAAGLIRAAGYKREVSTVSHTGFAAADALSPPGGAAPTDEG